MILCHSKSRYKTNKRQKEDILCNHICVTLDKIVMYILCNHICVTLDKIVMFWMRMINSDFATICLCLLLHFYKTNLFYV
jgi:hypothetical protein